MVLLATVAIMAYVVYFLIKSYYSVDSSHVDISDKKLLQLIDEERDGLMSIDRAMALTGMSKSQVKKRMSALSMRYLVNTSYGSSFKYYYSLKQPLPQGPFPELSSDPFLTIGDLMTLFEHFDYKLTILDIVCATGLPVNVIGREMKYFIKEKIVDKISGHKPDGSGMVVSQYYILRGEYRDNPERYLTVKDTVNLDLSKLYAEHKLRD